MRVFSLPAAPEGGGKGVTPWSSRRPERASRARQPTRPADALRSYGCDTTCTADAAETSRPDRAPPGPPTHADSLGSGRPPWRYARTARTRGARTGSACGCSATVGRTHCRPASRVAAVPRAHVSDSARPWSVRGTRGPSTGGGAYAAGGVTSEAGGQVPRRLDGLAPDPVSCVHG